MVGLVANLQLFGRRKLDARMGKRDRVHRGSRDDGRKRSGSGKPGVQRATLKLPKGADWMVWRIVLAPDHFKASKTEIETDWTLAELMQAHLFLDQLEALQAE